MRRIWGFFVFLLAAGGLGASAYLYLRLQREEAARAALAAQVTSFEPRFEQFKAAVRDVGNHLTATVFQEVDLGASGWQPIAGGFYIIDITTAPAGKGVKIGGKIINPTSVTHEDVRISMRVGTEHADITLAKLPPAVATPFEVTLQNVPPASVHKAYVALQGSTITFASSTTRKRPGDEPVDADKLLR